MPHDDLPRRWLPAGSRRDSAADTAVIPAVGDVLGRPRARRPQWDSFVLLTVVGVMAIIALLGVIVAGRTKEPPRSTPPDGDRRAAAPLSSGLPLPVEIRPAASSTVTAIPTVGVSAGGPAARRSPATAGPDRSPAPPAPATLTAGQQISLEPADAAGFLLRHDSKAEVRIDPAGTGAAADATFLVTAGLADPRCFSFQTVDGNGEYLRHKNFKLYVSRDNHGSLFSADATFCPAPGTAAGTLVLRSDNYPDRYVHEGRGQVRLDEVPARSATAFRIRPPR